MCDFTAVGSAVLSAPPAVESERAARAIAIGLLRQGADSGAGFAADAYARVHGLGAVCITYCVGGLKVANTTAEAFAEKSPVVIISGAPGMKERKKNPLLHHKVKDFRTQLEVFEKLCVACTELNDPVIAFREIDRVLDTAARFKRPLELVLLGGDVV